MFLKIRNNATTDRSDNRHDEQKVFTEKAITNRRTDNINPQPPEIKTLHRKLDVIEESKNIC